MKEFLISSARRLLRLLLLRAPVPIILNELATLFVYAQKVYGKQALDEAISTKIQQVEADDAATAAGLCGLCHKHPAIPNDWVCISCDNEGGGKRLAKHLRGKAQRIH